MATFTLTVDMSNFVTDGNIAELQDILTKLANRFNWSPAVNSGDVRDSLGTVVGDWEITAPPATFKEQVDELEQAINDAMSRSMEKRSQIATELHGRVRTLRVRAPESEWPRLTELKMRILNELLGMNIS